MRGQFPSPGRENLHMRRKPSPPAARAASYGKYAQLWSGNLSFRGSEGPRRHIWAVGQDFLRGAGLHSCDFHSSLTVASLPSRTVRPSRSLGVGWRVAGRRPWCAGVSLRSGAALLPCPLGLRQRAADPSARGRLPLSRNFHHLSRTESACAPMRAALMARPTRFEDCDFNGAEANPRPGTQNEFP
jgi:hypothetical protein